MVLELSASGAVSQLKQLGSVQLFIFRGQGDFRISDNALFNQALAMGYANGVPTLAVWRTLPQDVTPPASLPGYEGLALLSLPPMGQHRSRFLTQNAESLARQLVEYHIPLMAMNATASDVVHFCMAEGLGVAGVYLSAGSAWNEQKELNSLHTLLQEKQVPLYSARIHTLYDVSDYPIPLRQLPRGFTQFRHLIEQANTSIRYPLAKPVPQPLDSQRTLFALLNTASAFSLVMPRNFHPPEHSENTPRFNGSIEAGHARLNDYIWGNDLAVRRYKTTRNSLLGDENGGSRFSPWLASGALSPREVMQQLHHQEQTHGKTNDTHWLYLELLWREYFQCLAEQQGIHLFKPGGIQRQTPQGFNLKDAQYKLELWHQGKTGVPLCDAAMNELRTTGYMSNRARQNVASLFAKGLKLPWWWGAAVFEHYLVDYDPASNYANWQYVAGVGNDSRNRTFNLHKQSMDYDPQGEFIHYWLPNLRSIPAPQCFNPWGLNALERGLFGIKNEAELTPLLPELVGQRSFYLG